MIMLGSGRPSKKSGLVLKERQEAVRIYPVEFSHVNALMACQFEEQLKGVGVTLADVRASSRGHRLPLCINLKMAVERKTSGFHPLVNVGTGPARGRPSRYFSKILAKIRLQHSVE